MSRGGMYRSYDGRAWMHMRFGGQAPSPCSAVCFPEDDPGLFGGKCARPGGLLCDGPVGETLGGKPITCDAPICKRHATSGGPNIDYCPQHSHLAAVKP